MSVAVWIIGSSLNIDRFITVCITSLKLTVQYSFFVGCLFWWVLWIK